MENIGEIMIISDDDDDDDGFNDEEDDDEVRECFFSIGSDEDEDGSILISVKEYLNLKNILDKYVKICNVCNE